MKNLGPLALFGLLMLFGGCGEAEEIMLVRMHLEAPTQGQSEGRTRTVTLERSGLSYPVYDQPMLLERMITNVELVRVASGRLALAFTLTDEGRRELYRRSVADRGRAVVTIVNGVPIGARVLDGPISDGVFYTFAELPPEPLSELAVSLQENAVVVQEMIAERSMLR